MSKARLRTGSSPSRRVLICITGLGIGGAETVLAEMLAYRPDDMEIKVVTLIDGGEMVDRIERMGVPVTGLHMTAGVPSFGAFFRLLRTIRAYRPDVVHTWMYHADLLGGVTAKLLGVPRIIWHLHNSDLSPDRTRPMTRLVVRVCASLSRLVPNLIISCSDEGARIHEQLGYDAKRMVVLPNGVDATRFVPSGTARRSVRAEFGIPEDALLVGMVARLDPQKNHRGFFQAVRIFFEQGGDAYFLLVGKSVTPDHWQLPVWRSETAHPERIVLAGPRLDVPRLMAGFDVATSASLGEAFPVVLIEAMSCGIPCVATDVGDCRLLIADTGLVVPPGDPISLARAWMEMLQMGPQNRAAMGTLARQRVLDNYTIERFASRVWGYYRGDI